MMYAIPRIRDHTNVDMLTPPRSMHCRLTSLLAFTLLAVFLTAGVIVQAQTTSPSYTTNFQKAENPISENGTWTDGKTVGLDWSNVQTTSGLAFGTQDGAGHYDDSTAVLNGSWAADQSAQATVNLKNRTGVQEVELRLRTTISAHSITGYEINFSVGSTNYIQVVRWNGALNDFTYLDSTGNYTISNGDVVKASISGNTITVYLNGKQVLQSTDSSFSSGYPGMGFFIANGGSNSNFGFSNFTATGGSGTTASKNATASPAAAGSNGTYTTTFPATENPISENGNWINGKTTGLKWQNVRTTSGFAFGTETGSGGYDDSTAVLTGSWNADQTAQATVKIAHADSGNGVFEEVEVRLRTTISANNLSGYEINCSVIQGNPYMQIVRWNGPLGSWTLLDARDVGCRDGDVLKATITGSTITAYKNGSAVFSVNDSTFKSGSPGIGFYLQGGNSSMSADFGFSSFTATGGSGSTSPAPPTNLTAAPQ